MLGRDDDGIDALWPAILIFHEMCIRDSICIEPWYSVPAYDGEIDALETKRDMIHLNSGDTYENSYVISIK